MRVIRVANTTPNANEVAIGMRNCACTLFSKSRGVRPTKVVSDVKMIGRKRATPDSRIASCKGCHAFLARLMKSTITKLSLTTTPVRATMPNMERKVKSMPIRICPQIAPTNPNGIALITIKGCE